VALDVVRVEVRDRPTPAMLRSVGLEEDELLLGLYEGVPLTERSVMDAPRPPDVIYLFKHDLEDACDDVATLAAEVRTTLLHELGHYFGFGEDELEELGYR
jgi:predicted Zn-dependent protease with MMP-like domain